MLCRPCKRKKSPGNDGLTVQSLNYAFENGELSNSQKQAVITLVEKKGKDKRQIKNWRSISWPSGWKMCSPK